MLKNWDIIIVGAGTAGIPAAIFSAKRGQSVLVLDSAKEIGGTLHLSSGQMSAAGTKLQRSKGITDSSDMHYNDIMRISKNTAHPQLTRLAVDNASETLNWLEQLGFQPLAEHPVKGQAHEPYSVPRYVWGKDKGISILDAITAPFNEAISADNVELKLNTRVKELTTASNGAVNGVIASTKDNKRVKFSAKNIILTAGGYAANRILYEELSGHPAYADHSYPYCIGDALSLSLDVGGVAYGHDNFLTSFGAIMQSYDVPSKIRFRPNHWPEKRMPWEIYVNAHGKRFIREDEPSVDTREHTIQKQPNMRHWIIFDSTTLKEAPPLINDVNTEIIRKAAEDGDPMFYKANTISQLASKAGLPSEVLNETVIKYNIGRAKNSDAFNRIHMPRPIDAPPFYAIRSQAMSVSSTVGVKVDNKLRVVNSNGEHIPGLYAAGESLGTAMMGSSFCGGMLVTPALTFGKILGESLS
ncbi:MAG: hypothetical protein CMM25_02150 [Rhodospirillaceae bacterium]|nr:hypothetical protein [Rhodospirillaceae bacterium]